MNQRHTEPSEIERYMCINKSSANPGFSIACCVEFYNAAVLGEGVDEAVLGSILFG